MDRTRRHDPFAGLKGDTEGYRVFDEHYDSVGRVDDLIVDDRDNPLYIGVKTGLLATRVTLVPIEIVRVNDKRRIVEIAGSSEQIKHAPSFEDNEELTPGLEDRVHAYFGLRAPRTSADHAPHGPADGRVDLIPGERKASEPLGTSPLSSAVPVAEPGSTDTEPGKEWARGTQGHRSEPEERAGGHRTKARRLRR